MAKDLGLDFVPAIVGFNRKPGRTLPNLDGIIIHESFKNVLIEAYTAWAEELVKQQELKHEKVVIRRWELFVRNILTRQRLKADYGNF